LLHQALLEKRHNDKPAAKREAACFKEKSGALRKAVNLFSTLLNNDYPLTRHMVAPSFETNATKNQKLTVTRRNSVTGYDLVLRGCGSVNKELTGDIRFKNLDKV